MRTCDCSLRVKHHAFSTGPIQPELTEWTIEDALLPCECGCGEYHLRHLMVRRGQSPFEYIYYLHYMTIYLNLE